MKKSLSNFKKFSLIILILPIYFIIEQKVYVDLDIFYLANIAKAIDIGSQFDPYLGEPVKILPQYSNNYYFDVIIFLKKFINNPIQIHNFLSLIFILFIYIFYWMIYLKFSKEGNLRTPKETFYNVPNLAFLIAITYAPYGYFALTQASTPMYIGLLFFIYTILLDIVSDYKFNLKFLFFQLVLTFSSILLHPAFLIPYFLYFVSIGLINFKSNDFISLNTLRLIPLILLIFLMVFYYSKFDNTVSKELLQPSIFWSNNWISTFGTHIVSPLSFFNQQDLISIAGFFIIFLLSKNRNIEKFRAVFLTNLLLLIPVYFTPFIPEFLVSRITEIGFFRIAYPLFTLSLFIFPIVFFLFIKHADFVKKKHSVKTLFIGLIIFNIYNFASSQINNSEGYFKLNEYDYDKINKVIKNECSNCKLIADTTLAYNLGPFIENHFFLSIMPNRMKVQLGSKESLSIENKNNQLLLNPLTGTEANKDKFIFFKRRKSSYLNYAEGEYAKLKRIYMDRNLILYTN